MRKPYTAKSLSGAQKRVRQLQRQVAERDELLNRWDHERRLLARLASKPNDPIRTQPFLNPLTFLEAEQIRDRILKLQ